MGMGVTPAQLREACIAAEGNGIRTSSTDCLGEECTVSKWARPACWLWRAGFPQGA